MGLSVFHTKLHLCFTPNLSSLLYGAVCVSHQTSSEYHTTPKLIIRGYLCFTPNFICVSHQTSAHCYMGLSVFHTKLHLCFTPNLNSLLYGAICVSHQTSAHCYIGLSVFNTKLQLTAMVDKFNLCSYQTRESITKQDFNFHNQFTLQVM